ncbi:hypothetical protein VM1G_00761 [Cytospora mali]|uniref:Uncharacterized protein n=1 Tax=Cytospora mali TaxID=578113 RepID=A0A194VND0_CYTMA|nr:hypothetical protein VM1G_00761 [Valsa mali]
MSNPPLTRHSPSSSPSSPTRPETFLCTFCWRPQRARTTPSRVVGRGARLACEPCYSALLDLAGVMVGELFDDDRGVGYGVGESKGREVDEVPLCGKCVEEMARDEAEGGQLVSMALGRIDRFDGGLSRRRWEAGMGRIPSRRTALEGDDIQDAGPGMRSSEVPTRTFDGRAQRGSNPQARRFSPRDETNTASSTRPLETQEPDGRYASSPVYVSMHDPIGQPAFRPSKTKPIPKWMQYLPSQRHGASDCVDRPPSVLDDYFSPPEASTIGPDSDTDPEAIDSPLPPPVPPHTVPVRSAVPTIRKIPPTPPEIPNTPTRSNICSRSDPNSAAPTAARRGPAFSPVHMSRPFTLIAEEPVQRPSSKLGAGRLPPSRHVRFISPPQASSSSVASDHRSERPSGSSEFLERHPNCHGHHVGEDGLVGTADEKWPGRGMGFQRELKRVLGFS